MEFVTFWEDAVFFPPLSLWWNLALIQLWQWSLLKVTSLSCQWRGEKQVTKPLRVLPAPLARDRALGGLWSPWNHTQNVAFRNVGVFLWKKFPSSYHCLWRGCDPKRVISTDGLIPGWGRSPGEGNGNPLQYSCLENPMDRGAWWATVHGVAKNQTRLSDWICMYMHWVGILSSEQEADTFTLKSKGLLEKRCRTGITTVLLVIIHIAFKCFNINNNFKVLFKENFTVTRSL